MGKMDGQPGYPGHVYENELPQTVLVPISNHECNAIVGYAGISFDEYDKFLAQINVEHPTGTVVQLNGALRYYVNSIPNALND